MNFFKGTPKNPKAVTTLVKQENKPAFDIPQMGKLLPIKAGTKKRRKLALKYKLAFWAFLFIVLAGGIFTAVFFVSQWFDINQIVFQQPVFVKTQTPVFVQKRFILSPIPKATYVEVSPLTSPQQIDEAAKNNTVPQYADSGGISPVSKDIVRTLIHNKVIEMFGASKWPEVDYIITHESDYNPYIVNKNSGACGIFQALPCSKLPSLDITDQINWGMHYIQERYGTADAAYKFKLTNGWY